MTLSAPFLDAVRARVDARLHEVLDHAAAEARDAAPEALPVLDAARDLTLRGGKRLRPALLFAAVEAVTPGDADTFRSAATDLGAALELLQSYLLAHDDWMDGDRVRRGAPSVHAALAARYGDEHTGACTAILAGDYLSCLVHDLVASLDLPRDRHRAVLRAFTRMEREVILGQCLDVTRSPDIERIHRLKTGSYTVRGPLILGHALAGGTDDACRALEAFAEPMGLAFQLRDDLLGAFGSEAETGKPVGGDFREGKQTALVAHALGHLGPADREALAHVLGNREATPTDIDRARALVASSGARAAAEERIEALRARCLEALDSTALRPAGCAVLGSIAHLLTDRTR